MRLEWIDGIPDDWQVAEAQFVLDYQKREVQENDEIVTAFRDGQVTLRSNRRTDGFTMADKEVGYQHICEGDLVVHSMDGGFGAIGVSDSCGKASPVVHAYTSNSCDLRFISYQLRSAVNAGWIAALAKGIRVRSTQFDRPALAGLKIAYPSQETQRRIADYLDRETAEIDATVADLDRYVELLEKRRLLIVDEVLESSGVATSEWPKIPLKLIIDERFVGDWGGDPGTAEIDASCVRVADFDRPTNTVSDQVPTTRSYSRDKYEAKRLRYHDLLVERSGGGEKTPVGSAMLYTGGNGALCANFIEIVRLKSNQLPEFWVHILRREYMGRTTMRFVKQTTGIQNLDPQGFYDQKFPVPNLSVQRSLAAELRARSAEIDALIAESTKLRDLLLKRRSVLITDVVTGRKQV